MLLSFHAEKGNLIYHGHPIYEQATYSLRCEPLQFADCSVLIADLEIHFDSVLRSAIYVSGFHPHVGWIPRSLVAPQAWTGSLFLLEETIEGGVSVRLDGTYEWNTSFDAATGWVCIGDERMGEDAIAVEFTTKSIAVLHQRVLTSVWLNPLWV